MIFGASGFHHMADDPPKGSKKNHSSRNNPYSSRGLDKFSSVLSELGAKKEKIMATTSSRGVAMVRFMHSTSQGWIPVIVRRRDDSQQEDMAQKPMVKELRPPPLTKEVAGKMAERREKKTERRWRPSYHMLVAMSLILLCIVMSGRVFAICCTSVWWYLLPKLKSDESGNTKKTIKRKKEYGKDMNDKSRRMVGGGGY